MRSIKPCVFYALIALLLTGSVVMSDSVVLHTGQSLNGEIIAEKEDYLVIDIGIDILKINKDKILVYEYTAKISDANDINEPEDMNKVAENITSDPQKLYKTADLNKMTVEKAVDRVSQAVVKVSSPSGMGSGFFINEQGYLITNYHVIEKETRIEVTVFKKTDGVFEKKKFKHVEIIATNPFVDLALLKVEDIGDFEIRYNYLGDYDDVTVGEQVFAIGNPLGLERTVTDGVISTKNRAFEGLVYLQTNADINPGNSGGPLFNMAGEVIGVTNMGYIFFGGLGFAIPIDYVKHFIENREAFAYDKDNPNTGFRYIQPDKRLNSADPEFLKPEDQ